VPVRLEGTSFEDVAKRVLQHRLTNGKAPGDPAQELIDYVCGSWPHFCRDTNPPEIPASAGQPTAGLATRCANWIAAFYEYARGDKGVPLKESQRRANICAACPKNQPFFGGCGSCVSNIQRLFFVWRRDRPLPREGELGACFVIGQHNGSAVLSEKLPPLTDEIRERLPDNCWRK